MAGFFAPISIVPAACWNAWQRRSQHRNESFEVPLYDDNTALGIRTTSKDDARAWRKIGRLQLSTPKPSGGVQSLEK
jgi:hypothetical protein